jgi:hypothetical protein
VSWTHFTWGAPIGGIIAGAIWIWLDEPDSPRGYFALLAIIYSSFWLMADVAELISRYLP